MNWLDFCAARSAINMAFAAGEIDRRELDKELDLLEWEYDQECEEDPW